MERVGSWPGYTRGPALSVVVTNHHAFVAIGEGGMAVLDVTDPAKPVRVGGFRPPGTTERVSVVGTRAYLTTCVHAGGGCEQEAWRGILVILDVSDPTRPKLLGSYRTGNIIGSLCVDGDRVFLHEGNRFHTVDVSNPNRPVALHVVGPTGEWGWSVLWAGHQQVCTEGRFGWVISDIGPTGVPTVVTNISVGGEYYGIRSIQVVGDRVYAVEGRSEGPRSYGRLSIYQALSGTVPAYLGQLELPSMLVDVQVAGNCAFAVTSRDGLAAIDISNPSNPSLMGMWDTPGQAMQLAVANGHAFVADCQGGLQVFDIRNPRQCVQIAGYDTGLTAREVHVSGRKACILSSDGPAYYPYVGESRSRLEIIDISNPTQPWLLESYEAPWTNLLEALPSLGFDGGGINQRIAEGYRYAGLGWEGFQIEDVHELTNTFRLSGYDTVGEVHDLWVTNNYVYVAEGWEGVEVFDARQPTQLFPVGRVTTRGQAYGISVAGSYAYVAEGGGGLGIFALAPGPVTIIEDPASIGAALGDSATLTVRAYGRGPLSYQWYRGESGDISRPLAGATGASFTTPPLAEASACWVRVSGTAGTSDSRTAWIHLSPPVSVELLSLWPGYPRGPATDVQVVNNLAYIATGNAGLAVYDITHPAAPRRLGGYNTQDWASGIAVSGNWVFLACGAGGLQIIDASNPSAPVRVAGVALEGWQAHKVVLAGSSAYVAGERWDNDAQTCRDALVVVDVSTPANPAVLGKCDAGGTASGIAVVGNLAYLATEWIWTEGATRVNGLAVIDLTVPEAPQMIGRYDTSTACAARGVAVAGGLAYLAGGSRDETGRIMRDFLAVLDVSNPTRPQRVGGVDLAQGAERLDCSPGTAVAIGGHYAYVTGSGLELIDVNNPAAPRWVAMSSSNSWASMVRVRDRYAFVAAGDGLEILDITNPSDPRPMGAAVTGGDASSEDIAVAGNCAYLADGSTVKIIDVSDPTNPLQRGPALPMPGPLASAIALGSNRLYTAGQVWDISAADQPALLGRSADWGWNGKLMVAGDYLYESSSALRVVDVRDPAIQVLGGSFFDLWEGAWDGGMAQQGPYLFCARRWAGLQILDLSTPGELRHVAAYFSEAPTSDVAVYGDFAIITEGDDGLVRKTTDLAGLEVVDITSPQRPVRVAKLPLTRANNVAMMGSYACVTGEGLQIFDVAAPYDPILVGRHQSGLETRGLQVVGNLVYVAAGENGLAIYRVVPQLKLNPPVREGNGLRLSWLGTPGLRLQRTKGLAPPTWEDVPNSEGVSSLWLSSTNAAGFFRLTRS